MNEHDEPAGPGGTAGGQGAGGQGAGEQGRPAGAAGPAPGPAGEQGAATVPVPAAGPRRGSDRAARVRRALASRAAGWVVAAVLAGAVAALAVVDATASPVIAGPVAFRVGGAPMKGFVQQVPAGPGGPMTVGPGAMIPGRAIVIAPGGQFTMGPVQFPGRPGAPARAVPGGQISVGPGGQVTIWPRGIRTCLVGPGWAVPGGPVFRPGPGWAMLTTPFGNVVSGTVGSVSGTGFTVRAGSRTVTVREQPSTVYRKAGRLVPASAVTKGARVAVIGSLNGSVLTASIVAVLA